MDGLDSTDVEQLVPAMAAEAANGERMELQRGAWPEPRQTRRQTKYLSSISSP